MSGSSPNLSVSLGVANGITIVARLDGADLSSTQNVTLLENYARNAPSDFPVSRAGSFVATNPSAHPQLIPSGTVFTCFAAEAAALIAAGAAE